VKCSSSSEVSRRLTYLCRFAYGKVQLRLCRSAASTAWSAAFRASSKVIVVFVTKTRINKTNNLMKRIQYDDFHKFKFLEQKLSLTLEASLPILHVPQEQLHFAKQKLHFDEIDAAR